MRLIDDINHDWLVRIWVTVLFDPRPDTVLQIQSSLDFLRRAVCLFTARPERVVFQQQC